MPKNPAEGAAAIRKAALKLFARDDGEAADWGLIAESLLKVAFDCLDRVSDDGRRSVLLHQIEAGTYDRLARNTPEPWQDTPAGPESLPLPGRRIEPDGLELGRGPRRPRRH